MIIKQPALTGTLKVIVKFSFLFFALVIVSATVFSQSKYIKKFRPLADSLGKVYGIPAGVILGVAIVESSAGEGRNAKLLNNHFGIVGKNSLMKGKKKIKTRYKYYPSATASYIDFCGLLSRRKFYSKLKKNLNSTLWVDAISKSGYSELPSVWKQRVLSTIKKHRL